VYPAKAGDSVPEAPSNVDGAPLRSFMSIGEGKYDWLCTYVREQAVAKGAVIMVFEGNKGNGFSIQVSSPDILLGLPGVLRTMANQIEEDLKTQIGSQAGVSGAPGLTPSCEAPD
jgi:hypothetical protein